MMSQETITIHTRAGLAIVADVAGPANGPTVVLMHGGGQTRHSWSGAMRDLAGQGYRVLNYDSRGHGESEWATDGDYSIGAMADDLEDVLQTLSPPIALVGASMGGVTGFYAVGRAAHPIAQALVLVDITLRPAPEGTRKIIAFMQAHDDGFTSLEEAADAVAAYNPDRPRPSDPKGLRKNLRERDGRLYWHWDPRVIKMTPSSEPPDFASELIGVSDGVTIPTLLVRGGKSDVVDDAGVEEMLKLVPQTQVADVAGAGHMVAGDRNDAFNRAIVGFLQDHLPR